MILGLAALGLLVGAITGLSSGEVTATLMSLLFAMIGGSVIVLVTRLDAEARALAGNGLCAFSLAALIGLFGGLTIRINDLAYFGTPETRTTRTTQDAGYLRSEELPIDTVLLPRLCSAEMSLAQACSLRAAE